MSESDVNPLLRRALANTLKNKGLSNPNKKKIVPQGKRLTKKRRDQHKTRKVVISNNNNSLSKMAKKMANETPQPSCLSGMCTISGGGTGASTMKIPEIVITQDNLHLLEVGDLIRFYYGAGFNTRHGVIESITDSSVNLRNVSHDPDWVSPIGEERKMERATPESIPKNRIGNMIKVFKYDTPSGIAEEVHNNLRPSTPENPEETDNLPPSTPENPEEADQTTGGKRKRKKRRTRKKKKRKTKRKKKKRKTRKKKKKRKTKKKRGGMDGEKQPERPSQPQPHWGLAVDGKESKVSQGKANSIRALEERLDPGFLDGRHINIEDLITAPVMGNGSDTDSASELDFEDDPYGNLTFWQRTFQDQKIIYCKNCLDSHNRLRRIRSPSDRHIDATHRWAISQNWQAPSTGYPHWLCPVCRQGDIKQPVTESHKVDVEPMDVDE
tara:strand:+ start:6993 stop:8312 length:1320 start_codon:yes stop_codon:yes gene_type:complete